MPTGLHQELMEVHTILKQVVQEQKQKKGFDNIDKNNGRIASG
jgi:hypothetical protein